MRARAWVAAGLLLVACGSGEEPGTSAGPGVIDENATLRVAEVTPPVSLDPHRECHIGCRAYWLPVFETLYDIGENAEVVPLLAEGLPEYSADGLQVTIRLKEGRTFHDGTPIDAAAVKASLERGQTLPGSTVASTLRQVTAVDAVDGATVRLTLAAPRPGFEAELSGPAGALMSPAAIQSGRDLGLDPGDAGSGPYRVAEFVPNEKVAYDNSDDYWLEDRGRVAAVEIIHVSDYNTGLSALQSGQVDAAYANNILSDPSRRAQVENAGFVVEDNENLNTHGIYLRSTRSELADVRVRQALAHAIDRDAINESLFFGTCKPTSQPFASVLPAHVPDYDPFAYDPAKARELLASAGLPGGFSMNIVTVTGNPTSEQNAAVVQQMLGEIGVQVTLTPMTSPDGAAAFNRGEVDARSTVIAARADSLSTIDYYFTPGGVAALADPGGEELVALRKQLEQAPADQRDDALREMGRWITDQALFLPICYMSQQWAHAPEVQGIDQMHLRAFGAGLDIRGLAVTADD